MDADKIYVYIYTLEKSEKRQAPWSQEGISPP